ncbi:MAG: sulfotransferase family protein [Thermodesulfobacteriota bacterium]
MMSDQQPEAIFIVGNSRSGTTLMSKILNNHPAVFAFHELHFYERLWTPESEKKGFTPDDAFHLGAQLICIQREQQRDPQFVDACYEEAKGMLSGTGGGSLNSPAVYRNFLRYETKKQGKWIACEQTPRNVFYLQEILRQFAHVRIINMVRDPRDVLLSQKNKWKGKEAPFKERLRRWANYHPFLLSKMWNGAQRAAAKFADNSSVLTVRFEDLLSEPQTTVRNICHFLGLEYDSAMLDVSASRSPSREKEELEASQGGISTKPIGRWMKRLAKMDVYWCESINGEAMKRYGYKLSGARPFWFEKLLSLLAMPIKTLLALVLNIGNTRNLFASVKRRFL